MIDNTTRTPLGHQAVAEGNVDLIKIDETRSELSYTFNVQLRYSSVVADLHGHGVRMQCSLFVSRI